MIADRFLTRKQWEGKLRRWGCHPLEGQGSLNTAEWWRGPSGPPFTVPVEDDGSSDFWAIRKICERYGSDPALPFPDDPD